MAKPTAERVILAFQVFGMSNLRSDETGIQGVVIWISTGWVAGKRLKHGPRIKVYRGKKANQSTYMASVSCEAVPRVVDGTLKPALERLVSAFVVKNLDTLLRHWDLDIDSTEAVGAIKKLRKA